MARRKFEPGRNGESRIVEIPSSTNGVCENKLFYAHRLKELRTIAHLTQADLANALGLCKSAVANWESGRTRPDVSNIPTIAERWASPSRNTFRIHSAAYMRMRTSASWFSITGR